MAYSIMSEELRFNKKNRRKINIVYGKDNYTIIIAKFIRFIEKDVETLDSKELIHAMQIFNLSTGQLPVGLIDGKHFSWRESLYSLPIKDKQIILNQKDNLKSSCIVLTEEYKQLNLTNGPLLKVLNAFAFFDGEILPKKAENYHSDISKTSIKTNLNGLIRQINTIRILSLKRISAIYRIYQAATRNDLFNSMAPSNFSTQLALYLEMDSNPKLYHNYTDLPFQQALGIFLTTLYENEINFRLNQEHENESEGEYAKAFMTKRNISKEKQALMNNNSFIENGFTFLELDNSIDGLTFKHLEEKWIDVYKHLPRTTNPPVLRFRKLGQHNATGIYFSYHNCICVDVRDTTSLIHEYGHYLDYNYGQGTISLSEDFRPIIKNYKEVLLNTYGSTLSPSRMKYYSTPTEVFARAFEIWFNHYSPSDEFNKNAEVFSTEPQYMSFDPSNRILLFNFFNKIFFKI
ncbi:hypothetical protein [Enterococcus sp. DIV1059_2]|uniref:hypothetical protein n=1 Tax=Enterococcus sp. DIV1059_2 TaxID=2774664 RepID=UPI003F2372A6